MHERYLDPDLAKVWNDTRKFQEWLRVEVAVLQARERLGQIPEGTAARVEERTFVDDHVADLIKRRDEVTKHDLVAFKQVVHLQLILHHEDREFWDVVQQWRIEAEAAKANGKTPEQRFQDKLSAMLGISCREAELFHDGLTSYDVEEPAMALLLRKACDVLFDRLAALDMALVRRAVRHRGLIKIGRTHGQYAQPITFGVELLNWLEGLRVAHERFEAARREIGVMKLSGAVGMYGTLGPEVEDEVAAILGLEPVIGTQILGLGRRAQLVNTLAEVATEIGKIAHDLWLLGMSDIGEVREPFGKGQTGSSAMPHKKNPVVLEKLVGLPRRVRGDAHAELENVDTHLQRDISQSSVERNTLVDAFHATAHVASQLAKVVDGMDVFPERMARNLDRAWGTYASQDVERFLKERGMAAETAYRLVQQACFLAVTEEAHLVETLRGWPEVKELADADVRAFQDLFEPRRWVRHEEAIYRRFDARWEKDGYASVLEG